MKQSLFSKNLLAVLLIIGGAILVSAKAIFVKLAYQFDIDSLSLLVLRMLFSLPFFVGALFFQQKNTSVIYGAISTPDAFKIVLIGCTGYYGASYLDFLGLQYISASLERMILYTYPTLVLIISVVFLGAKLSLIQVIALLITYGGLAMIFLSKMSPEGNQNPWLGGLLVFGAALTYSIYLVGSGELLPRIGTRRFTAYSMIAAAIVVIIHYLIASDWQLLDFPLEVYVIVLLMAVFATVIPLFMMSEGLRIIGASNAAIIGAIGPVSTIIMAYFILGERLYPLQWIGTLVVIAGVLVISLEKAGTTKILRK